MAQVRNRLNEYKLHIALTYLLIPVIIFLVGYLNLPAMLIMLALAGLCVLRFWKKEKGNAAQYRKSLIYGIAVLMIVALWAVYSGIGGFAYQNVDYEVRNAVLRDLIDFKWPVIFDFSQTQTEIRDAYDLYGNAGFVYYFTYWMPSALFGKAFGQNAANVFLLAWSVIGLLLIVSLINNYCGRQTFFTILFLIGFSGMDYLIARLSGVGILDEVQIEWWNDFLQYSSTTTLLYWVFNQAIPCWLIVTSLMNAREAGTQIFVSSLIFFYSPFATFGMIPVTAYFVIKKLIGDARTGQSAAGALAKLFARDKIWIECIWCAAEVILLGTLYLSADSSISERGLLWQVEGISFADFMLLYAIFILVELGFSFIVLVRSNRKNPLFWVVMAELLLIPFYKMTPANDFCMRASIAPLFILMMLAVRHFAVEIDWRQAFVTGGWARRILSTLLGAACICLFAVGAVTPLHEIYRSVSYTHIYQMDTVRDEYVYSIGNPITLVGAELCDEQFYARDYTDSIFFRYFARGTAR